MLTMWLTGRVVDRYSYGPVFVGLGCLPLLAFGFNLLAARGSGRSGPDILKARGATFAGISGG